ncbi:MAG: choice-of-anchor B domain-containing protein [Patiriisocius sp.]|jgi:choice-of-anchor B domain-containing protein
MNLAKIFIIIVLSVAFSSVILAQECDTLFIQLDTGIWAEEVSWNITDLEGAIILTETGFEDDTSYYSSLCLYSGCYTFNMYDTDGDGWQGAVYRLFDSNNELMQIGQLSAGFEGTDTFSFNTVCGCTDSLAYNFEPEAGADDGSCFYCEGNYLTFQLSTGIWAEEISWNLIDSLGNILYENSNYLDNTFYLEYFCLPDACYTINMYDSYGDGWQGGEFTLLNNEEQLLASGFVGASLFESSVVFSVNGDCVIPGCLEPTAVNYNPMANYNDGSCILVSDNVSLLGHWSKDSLVINSLGGSYTDVYGTAINDREYGIIGSTAGTHIVDVTDPELCSEVAFIPGAFNGTSVSHRDYHTHNNFLYAVCDQGSSTLQIIDISNLPEEATVVYDSDELFSRTHNIFIDTLTSKLYAVSASGNFFSSSLIVYDISNETNPVFLYNLDSDFSSAHDIYVENDTAYVNAVGLGLLVYDFSGAEPQIIGVLDDYPFQGTNHSGWLDNERDVYVFADENHGYDLKVCDVSNLTDINIESTFNSDVHLQSIAHNLIIRDNYVFLSYYHDGLQIFDISDPTTPIKAGYYDTYLQNSHLGFAGAWGIYPNLPSDNILISDIMTGLYVLRFEPEQITVCEGDSVLVNGNFESDSGIYISTVSDSTFNEDILVTELEILSNSYSFDTLILTVGDSILFDNVYYSEDGVYSYTIENSLGCDSIITLDISFVVGIIEMNLGQGLSFYPNPSIGGTFKIEINNSDVETIEILDANGRLVIELKGQCSILNIDLSGEAIGVYFIKAYTKDGIFTKKILVIDK